MAISQIETGYKPEFALGAMYQGENAANADMNNKLEFIKQYLANQHAQVQNPLDEQTTAQNLLINAFKTDPRYQQGMTDVAEGQGLTTLTAGQNAQVLQKFKQAAEEADLKQQASKSRLFGNMFSGLEKQYNPELQDNERAAAGQNAWATADTLSRIDPKVMADERLWGMRLDSAEENAKLRATAGVKPIGDPKTAQETMQRILAKKRRGEVLTQDDLFAYNEAAAQLDAINSAKVQPGTMLAPNAAPEILQPKPAQKTVPRLDGGQGTAPTPKKVLSPAERAALIKSLQERK